MKPYGAQMRFLQEVCQGLDQGQRFFVNLKARQLGITTISLAIDIFWMNMHKGLRGALIADSDENKEVFRNTIQRYIESLPKGFLSPVVKNNKYFLLLENGSRLDYLVAGKKRNADLGTSRGFNFVHATEVAKWGGGEGLDSLMASMAETHPDRLYIFESTAKGFNHWHEMWNAAKDDRHSQRAFFIGWWAKEIYAISKSDPRYAEVMQESPTQEEQKKAAIVWDQYGHKVTHEQLAWYRWRSQNRTFNEGSMEQEYPWHEEEAFIVTGQHFFPARKLTEDLKRVMDGKSVLFKAYRYNLGEQFLGSELSVLDMEPVSFSSEAHLRVWEPPKTNGVYVIGVDPAYGRNDWQDRHAISVWRCFADKLVQVAEYATPIPETWQVIWVLAHLASQYRDCLINLEVNGPGTTIMTGLKQLKSTLRAEAQVKGAPEAVKGFTDALGGARWYLYHRPDSMGAGYAYGWKTTLDANMVIMNQMRDSYHLGSLVIRSAPLLREMQTIVQEGASIAAYGKGKDDRVFAAALAHKAWIEWRRSDLQSRGRTYAQAVAAEAAGKPAPQDDGMVGGIVRNFFQGKEQERKLELKRRAFGQVPVRW